MRVLYTDSLSARVLSLVVIILLSTKLVAQTPSPTESTKESFVKYLSDNDRRTYQATALEFELLMQRKLRGLTDPLRSQLAFNLERLVALTCMPTLSTKLEYSGPPSGAECLRSLSLLKEILPSSPALLCAEHGIQSESCKDAYNEQYISNEELNSEKDNSLALDIKTKLEATFLANSLAEQNLSDLEYKYENEQSVENKTALLNALKQKIGSECSVINNKLVDIEPPKEWKVGYIEVIRKDDPLVKMIEEFSKDKTETSPDQQRAKEESLDDYAGLNSNQNVDDKLAPLKKLWRIRYIDSDCIEPITRALELDPNFPEAVCFRESYQSPNCINAKISAKQKMRSGNIKNNTGSPSNQAPLFETF